MTQQPTSSPELPTRSGDQTLICSLRRRAGRVGSLSLLAAATLAAFGVSMLASSPTWLNAGQFNNEDESTSAADPMIVPRGADVHSQMVVNPRSLPPRGWNQTTTRSVPKGQSRQASLGRPVFDEGSTDPSDSNGIQTSPPGQQLPSRSSANTLNSPGSAVPRRNGQANSVDPYGLDSIPFGGRTRTAMNQDGTTPSTPVPPVPVPPVPDARFGSPNGFPPNGVPSGQAPIGNSLPQNGIPEANYGDEQNSGSTMNPSSDATLPLESQGAVTLPNHESGPVPLPGHSSEQPVRSGHSGLSGRPVPNGMAPGTSGFRANVESDAPGWIGPYMGRTDSLPSTVESSPAPRPSVVLPPDFTAWWDPLVQQQSGIAPRAIPVDVSTLVQQALMHSPRVQVLQANPEVEYRVVRQEEAAFDWRAFLDAKYDDLNDPIGNKLTTGNNSGRFANQQTSGTAGFKRRTESGGELEISQKVGVQKNNSQYLIPNPQSTSRLELSFRQPLLNQAGTVYNQSQIVLARINANSTGDETLEELQNHLFSVAEAYWKLYRARAEFFQRQKLLTSAQDVLTTLEARNQVDTIPRQLLRAKAAVARAESRMQRAVTDIRNAESQLRLLVNDPEMLNSGPTEFTPLESPSSIESPVGLRESLQTALVNRPDISQAIRQMRASSVRMGVGKQDVLPKLDFIVSTYVAGLQGQTQVGQSIGNQFSQGRPGYTVGMEFEVPIGNRAAKAKLEQRQWELKRAINGFRATVEASLTEVEIANREVETAYRELLGKYQAMEAARNEVAYLQDRFAVLPMVEESSMLLLEDLLDGYERLADEEAAFAQAQVNYALAIIQLRRTTGVLMRSRHDAPELDPSESQWMASRAEQASEEAGSPLRDESEDPVPDESESAEYSANGQVHAPASWTQPVGQRPGAAPATRPATFRRPAPAAGSAPRVGGHSFGTN